MRHPPYLVRWLTLAAVSLWVWPLHAQVRAYTGATIIDGNGGPPLVQGVLLTEGAKITAVGAAGLVRIPAGAERVDLTGKYLVPGLIDGNVHLVPWPSWTYIEFLARYEDNFDGIALEAAQLALKKGFTTLFDSMGPARPEMRVRDRINRGEQVGPRLFIAGDIVGFRAVFTTRESIAAASKAFQARINAQFELNGGPDLAWLTPDQVRVEMTKYVNAGVDFVKYGATGDGAPLNSEFGQEAVLRFTPAQQRAMVEAVHAAGNITSKSDVGAYDYATAQSGCTYQSYVQPHAVRNAGGAVYCYDANGNAISRGGGVLVWTSYNLPSSIAYGSNATSFNYNANHQRWKQDANYAGTHEVTYYIGGLMEKVTTGAGPTEYRHRIPAGSGSVILTRRSNMTSDTYYTTSDHLGSGDLILSSTGTILAKESFTPFGARRGSNWQGIPSVGDYSTFSSPRRQAKHHQKGVHGARDAGFGQSDSYEWTSI